jgi:ribA/ribD-fused uncharacterized protein
VFESVERKHGLDDSCEFTLDGVAYKSVEHYYQSCKYKKRYDVIAEEIRDAPTALDAKKLNTKYKKKYAMLAAEQIVWFETGHQVEVMRAGVLAKFTQNEKLRKILLATGTATLHETRGRSVDIWAYHPGAAEMSDDMMGKILMSVRDELSGSQARIVGR